MLKAVFTGSNSSYQDLDKLNFPDYEPFGIQDMIDNYSDFTRLLYRYSRLHPRPYSIVASRSCPFTCTFCIHGHRDIPYRARSIESIMEEIRVTYEKYHFNILILLDELFAVSKGRMNDFSDGVLEGKQKYGWDFDWMFQTHASAKLDLESLKKAKEAGCISFSYGLESASPVVLKSMDKRIKVEQVIEAIHLAKEAKIGFSANLIFGDPAETQETIAESLAFWLEYGRGSCIFLAQLKPYPGSKIFQYCIEKGLIKDKKEYYETIDKCLINMTAMSDETFNSFMSLLNHLENQWLFVKTAKASYAIESPNGTVIEKLLGGEFVQIRTLCPNCGEESVYRMHRTDTKAPFFMGTSCLKCEQKMKVIP